MGTVGYDPDNIRSYIINMVDRQHGATGRSIKLAMEGVFPNLDKNYLTGLLEEMADKLEIIQLEYSDKTGVHSFYIPKDSKVITAP